MATVLLTWELGGGIGHIMNLRALGLHFAKRGHRVIAALRDISEAERLLAGTGISHLQAPLYLRSAPPRFNPAVSFLHLLANVGFGDVAAMRTIWHAWNTLFDLVQPDLVIADHSPSALLALRGRKARCVNVGIGFFVPPKQPLLPHWIPQATLEQLQRLEREEAAVLEQTNAVLCERQRPPLQRLSDLYSELDDNILATYEAFDHFGPRAAARYWGHWPHGVGSNVTWPNLAGKRVYAYLKPFPALEATLQALASAGQPTVIVAQGLDEALVAKYQSPTIRFEFQPLDLREVAEQCDLAIINGNHGTAAALLLAGRACLLIPLFTEQLMFSRKVEHLGAARIVLKDGGAQVDGALRNMLTNPSYASAAQTFARRYNGFVPGEQLLELTANLEHHIQNN